MKGYLDCSQICGDCGEPLFVVVTENDTSTAEHVCGELAARMTKFMDEHAGPPGTIAIDGFFFQ